MCVKDKAIQLHYLGYIAHTMTHIKGCDNTNEKDDVMKYMCDLYT